jgi:ABC-type sugar transport system ATPase subunit
MNGDAGSDGAREGSAANAAPPILEAVGVSKQFGGQWALREADFALRTGSIHALVGENGAGKSTLIRLFAGIHEPDAGEIRVRGEEQRIRSPRESRDLNIGFLHQQLHLVPDLSVRENVVLANGYPTGRSAQVAWRRVNRLAEESLALAGASVDPRALVGELPTAQQQLVAFARVLLQQPDVIFLDEPTASLGEADSRHMLEVLREQRARGTTIVYISHRLDEVLDLCELVTVLRDGKVVSTTAAEGLTRDELVRMLGGVPDEHATPQRTAASTRAGAPPRLELRNVVAAEDRAPVSLELHPGEVLGLAGLVGSGRSRFAKALFGIPPIVAGEVLVDGERVQIGSARDALRHGIVLVPENRAEALVGDFGIAPNVSLGHVERHAVGGIFIQRRREEAPAREFVRQFAIKGSKEGDEVGLLSGGNQQKVLLARALDLKPRVLILDEPTAGIDIATKQFIYRLTRELAATGMSIVFISSELEEVSLVADRIAVWIEGRQVDELPAGTSRAAIVARLFADQPEVAA